MLKAIHGYRETERLKWNESNTKILDRVRSIAFPPNVAQLKFVHILDLDKNGYIKPHIDAIRVSYYYFDSHPLIKEVNINRYIFSLF